MNSISLRLIHLNSIPRTFMFRGKHIFYYVYIKKNYKSYAYLYSILEMIEDTHIRLPPITDIFLVQIFTYHLVFNSPIIPFELSLSILPDNQWRAGTNLITIPWSRGTETGRILISNKRRRITYFLRIILGSYIYMINVLATNFSNIYVTLIQQT